MTKISATVVADSINESGNRITTMKVVMPRMILAEFNTHRAFSRNTSSSRAVPFEKMVELVKKDLFIPIAFQRDHKGMQGTEYLTSEVDKTWAKDLWLTAARRAIKCAEDLHFGVNVTKQLCNRLLEPFMWTTVLVTASEWSNFFELRCPQYVTPHGTFKSIEQLAAYTAENSGRYYEGIDGRKYMEGMQISFVDALASGLNKGQSEIHMMALAERMWDARNQSVPKKLKNDEWHIPFGDGINEADATFSFSVENYEQRLQELKVKISTARCARISYTLVGDGDKPANYENDIKLHDQLLESMHFSPFEHSAQASEGWFDNFHGFQSYRNQLQKQSN